MWTITGIYLTLLLATINDGVGSDEVAPLFKSIPTTVKTTEHDTVLLPCYVQNQGTNKVMWWRGEELLAASSPKKVYANNIDLFENNTIQVSDLGIKDAGPYTCQVIREPPWGPINQTHVIAVLLPPTVRMYPEVSVLEVDQYKEVTLNCSATGSPKPLITWTFNGEEIQLLSQRNTLKILASSDRLSGEYACIASNGVGDVASASIYVMVTYAPMVTAPRLWIHAVPGLRTEIECNIDASPRAKVEWLQDKVPVETGTRIVTFRRENRYGLILLKTKKSDFGYYTCIASNSRGKGQIVIHVSGVPSAPVFKENYFQRDEKKVTLAWQVDSLSPIIQYNLRFREYKGAERPANWSKLVVPADAMFSNGPLHDQTYSLTGLDPATIYESSVLARNVYGWSKPSAIFRFATFGAELESHLTTEDGTVTNAVSDYMSEYVTLDSWNISSVGKVNHTSFISLSLLISFVHWWHEFRNN